jgi:hypothetical protein
LGHIDAAAAVQAPLAGDRVYAVTPRYWIDTTDGFEPVKQLPVTVSPSGAATELMLVVGETLSRDRVEAALRIGVAHADAGARMGRVTITVNGTTLYDGPADAIATVVEGLPKGRGVKKHPPVARAYLQVPINRDAVFRQGRNTIAIRISGATEGKPRDVVIGEVQLGVRNRVTP